MFQNSLESLGQCSLGTKSLQYPSVYFLEKPTELKQPSSLYRQESQSATPESCSLLFPTVWNPRSLSHPCSTQVRQRDRELELCSSMETSPGMLLQPPTTEKWERGRREQRAQTDPSPLGNSVYQFKLSISLLKVSPTSECSFGQITDI